MVSFIVANSGVITAYVNGKNFEVPPDHPNYQKIKEALANNDADAIESLANVSVGLKNFTAGKAEVLNGEVFYNGQPMHNVLTERILQLMNQGFPFDPMVKFLENLMNNPSSRAVNELYTFLSHHHLPITEDGCFLAYKRVGDDWKDFHSRHYDNSVGNVINMPRNQVDDNLNNGCGRGLHVGSIDYVRGFSTGGHIVVCKVNPANVVSVPLDCNCTKLRTCEYEVIAEYTSDLGQPVYDARGNASQPQQSSSNRYNDDYEDSDYEDEEDDWDSELEDDDDDSVF